MHLGAVDVIALPLGLDELQQALGQARQRMSAGGVSSENSHGRVIAFVKRVGGVGATALATQMGCLLAAREGAAGRETCLLDIDLQFGNAISEERAVGQTRVCTCRSWLSTYH